MVYGLSILVNVPCQGREGKKADPPAGPLGLKRLNHNSRHIFSHLLLVDFITDLITVF